MRQEIAECLELDVSYSVEFLSEKLIAYTKAYDEQENILREKRDIAENKHKLSTLPVQDTFWCLKEIHLKCKDLAHLRMLVLSDIGSGTSSSTIQFSLMEAVTTSCADQAVQLLYHGCLYPLDGRTSRKPRILINDLSDLDISSAAQSELKESGIHICMSLPSKNELESLNQSPQTMLHFRQCSVCQLSGSSDLFYNCKKCGAVLYCRARCQTEDWEESHHEWCSQFKQFMEVEAELADLPFEFASETTQRDFRKEKFFQKCGIYGQGLWQFECSDACHKGTYVDCSIDYEMTDSHVNLLPLYGLVEESHLLELPIKPQEKNIDGWSDYYFLRGLPFNSPMAVLLHYSLTLFYIISHLLPIDFHDCYESIKKSKKICIHLIGVEKEVHMFYPFLECARLLSIYSCRIHLFGNNFDDAYHDWVKEKENLHFHIHKGLYHRNMRDGIPAPDLAVCFNGGIGAYTSYIKTMKYLTRKKIPFYYTDYDKACTSFSSITIRKSKAGCVSEPKLNPFRSPLRIVTTDQNLPRYSNAVITHIAPFPKD